MSDEKTLFPSIIFQINSRIPSKNRMRNKYIDQKG